MSNMIHGYDYYMIMMMLKGKGNFIYKGLILQICKKATIDWILHLRYVGRNDLPYNTVLRKAIIIQVDCLDHM